MNERYIENLTSLIEAQLARSLPTPIGEKLSGAAEQMQYALTGGGKRIRPLLCLLFCELCGGRPETALPFALAVEMVHTYSLVHDDLPCMDDDDYRRGRLSSHKKYGEANAVLTGDALLTHAFFLIANAAGNGLTPQQCTEAAGTLSVLAGMNGMVGGQFIDLENEGKTPDADTLFAMDALKTGALIEAACELGCIAAGADAQQMAAAQDYALHLGLAFQIVDDLLEYEDENEHSDEENGKATYITAFGYEEAKRLAADHTDQAVGALSVFGERAETVRALSLRLLNRRT
ncbi:MAG: polyprenyl synthetase family protein [Clostridia bacterium]|nr:polyprenyl synthetase family protein [Clostridia bacterium]MBR0509563.1 polyprenyl synthetase family protein [Clostridia bacterium]